MSLKKKYDPPFKLDDHMPCLCGGYLQKVTAKTTIKAELHCHVCGRDNLVDIRNGKVYSWEVFPDCPITVWITDDVLLHGIIKAETTKYPDVCDYDVEAIYIDHGGLRGLMSGGRTHIYHHDEGKTWHKTKEKAINKATKIVNKKIKSLKGEITKLEAMKTNFK